MLGVDLISLFEAFPDAAPKSYAEFKARKDEFYDLLSTKDYIVKKEWQGLSRSFLDEYFAMMDFYIETEGEAKCDSVS